MLVLGIETSGSSGSTVLHRDGVRVAGEVFEKGMVHGRELVPSIDRLCVNAHVGISDIDLIGVDIGPGSYTGLRIGLAAAKAMAYAKEIALIGVSSLDVIAQGVVEHAVQQKTICAIIDGRWKELYYAVYRVQEGYVCRESEYMSATPEVLIEQMSQETMFVGDGLNRFAEVFAGRIQVDRDKPTADHVALLAWRRYRNEGSGSLNDISPMYMRPTEAEEQLMMRQTEGRS